MKEATAVKRYVRQQVEVSLPFCINCGTDKVNPLHCLVCGKFFGNPFTPEQKALLKQQRRLNRKKKTERRRLRRLRKRRGD